MDYSLIAIEVHQADELAELFEIAKDVIEAFFASSSDDTGSSPTTLDGLFAFDDYMRWLSS